MILKTRSADIDLTDEIKGYISKKFKIVDTLFSSVDQDSVIVEIELKKVKDRKRGGVYEAEVNVAFKAKLFRSLCAADHLFSAIDLAKDSIVGQIRKFRRKR